MRDATAHSPSMLVRVPLERFIFRHNLTRSVYISVGHAGHGEIPGHSNEGTIYSLEDQINHKSTHLRIVSNALLIIVAVAYLKSFKEGTKFILIGHSVGAYICLQVCYSITFESPILTHTCRLQSENPDWTS